MGRRILVTLADDTTATHCGECHHSGVDECGAFAFPGATLAWDEAAQSSVRSEQCHEAELSAPSVERVLGRAAVDDEPMAPAEVRCAPTARESER